MKNVYDGVVKMDKNGNAIVELPEWFEALNKDFRYQLTCIGGYAPVYIAEEIQNNQFKISGGKPGLKVSWQVTGIRKDVYANAHRIEVEVEKEGKERGKYLHPEEYGLSETMRIGYNKSHHKIASESEVTVKDDQTSLEKSIDIEKLNLKIENGAVKRIKNQELQKNK